MLVKFNNDNPIYINLKITKIVAELKTEFIKEFCNDHNDKIRWLRGVAYNMPHLLERILKFFDGERSFYIEEDL